MEPGYLYQSATNTHSATSYVPGFLFIAQVLSGHRGKCLQGVPYALLLQMPLMRENYKQSFLCILGYFSYLG